MYLRIFTAVPPRMDGLHARWKASQQPPQQTPRTPNSVRTMVFPCCQATPHGLQPTSDGLQPRSDGSPRRSLPKSSSPSSPFPRLRPLQLPGPRAEDAISHRASRGRGAVHVFWKVTMTCRATVVNFCDQRAADRRRDRSGGQTHKCFGTDFDPIGGTQLK